jgi:hypothetical protein
VARRSSTRIGLGAPALPLALAPALRSSLRRTSPNTVKRPDKALSSSSAFRQSIAQRILAGRPQPIGSSHGLCVPTAHEGSGGPLHAGFACPLRSAFRVWLPSWRFTPSEPAPVLFRTGGALGIHPSELSPLKRFPERFRPKAPTYRCSTRYTSSPKRTGRPGRPRFLGFDPFESPSRARRV